MTSIFTGDTQKSSLYQGSGKKRLSRKMQLLIWAAVPVILLGMLLGIRWWQGHTEQTLNQVLSTYATTMQDIWYYKDYDTYKNNPKSSYTLFKRQGLFQPLKRTSLMQQAESLAQAAGLTLQDVKIFTSEMVGPLSATKIQLHLIAVDDRDIYGFLRSLEATKDFLWFIHSFDIQYKAPNFLLQVEGLAIKFTPFLFKED